MSHGPSQPELCRDFRTRHCGNEIKRFFKENKSQKKFLSLETLKIFQWRQILLILVEILFRGGSTVARLKFVELERSALCWRDGTFFEELDF